MAVVGRATGSVPMRCYRHLWPFGAPQIRIFGSFPLPPSLTRCYACGTNTMVWQRQVIATLLGCAVAAQFASALESPVASLGTAAWIQRQTQDLRSPDARRSQAARRTLLQATESSRLPTSYPADMAEALSAVLKEGDCRARLNAGVVAERVSTKTGSPALVPLARELMADKSVPVALWGVKTARPLIAASAAQSAAKDSLAAAIVACAKEHPDSSAVIDEAYAALTPKSDVPDAAATKAALPHLLGLTEWRLGRFNADQPSTFTSEQAIDTFVAINAWPVGAPPERQKIVDDLVGWICVAANAVANGQADRALVDAARSHAKALEAIAAQASNLPLEKAAKAFENLTTATPAAKIGADCAGLRSAALPPPPPPVITPKQN